MSWWLDELNRWVDELMGWIDELMSWWVESMSWNAEKAPKRPTERPKTTPKRPKKRSQTTRRNKDRTKTILGPSWTAPGPICVVKPPPPGAIWEAKTVPKSIPKRSKIEEKNQEVKKPIQDDLGSVLRRSWAVLGAILGPWKRSGTTPADVSWTFTFSMLRRFEDGLGTNFGRPRRQNDRKWPPRRSPNRPQDDQKSMSKST